MSVLFYETPESMHARKKLARAVAAEVKKNVKASVTEVFKESRMEAMASGKLPQPIEGQTVDKLVRAGMATVESRIKDQGRICSAKSASACLLRGNRTDFHGSSLAGWQAGRLAGRLAGWQAAS